MNGFWQERTRDAGMAWVRGALAMDRATADRVARDRMSPSTAKALHQCPARWAFDKAAPAPADPFAAAPLGTAVHLALEWLYQLPPEKRDWTVVSKTLIPRAWRQLRKPDLDRHWPGIPTQRCAEWTALVTEYASGVPKVEVPSEVPVFRTEMRLDTVDVAGVPFRGTVDRVVLSAGGGFGVDDWKSGNVPTAAKMARFGDDHGDQLRLYRAALAAHLGGAADIRAARVIYTRHGVVRTADLSAAAVDRAVEAFVDAWRLHGEYIGAAEFPTVAGPLCGWCPLVDSCPAAHRGGWTAKVPGAPSAVDLGIPVRRAAAAPATAAAENGAGVADRTALSSGSGAGHSSRPGGAVMSGPMTPKLAEGKPWAQFVDGRVNPNSYSAMGAFGVVTLAVKELHNCGVPITRTSVAALSRTLLRIVEDAQQQLAESRSMQDGLHTRLRGALFTVLRVQPVPFGADRAGWSRWVSVVSRMVVSTADAAIDLVENGSGDPDVDHWEALLALQPARRVADDTTSDTDTSDTDTAAEHARAA